MHPGPLETLLLDIPGPLHPGGNGSRAFPLGPVRKFAVPDSRDLDVNVYPIEEWSREAGQVLSPLAREAVAGPVRTGHTGAFAGVC